ncbi:FAS-associated factor 1 [Patella vulgata]|uniref:FAS-associated factor 1 n=1 Tax=Patella vulgata TaxID=6465 RepID=UPI00217FE50A|nr:FAS-associated factor 1 [Patella vulgata]
MTRLIHSVEIFQEQQAADISEEQERTNREMIKQQQDADYEESLAADKAKAEIQREEEAKRQAVLEVELQKQREEERLRQEEEDAKKAIQRTVSRSLAVEPPEDATYPISVIRFRVKGGDIINRRFRADDTIQTLLNFLITKGFHTEEYKVLTTYPRRDITQLDESLTLESARLFPQETLILEEK